MLSLIVGILYNIRSLHNVGSIFRSADGAGMSKLYLGGITPAPMDDSGRPRLQLVKVSLGAERTMAWEKISRTGPLLEQLRRAGYVIFGLELNRTAKVYYRVLSNIGRRRTPKIALLVGHELQGLPKTLLTKCDTILKIPMNGTKESLNVAVAFAIAAFRLKEAMEHTSRS